MNERMIYQGDQKNPKRYAGTITPCETIAMLLIAEVEIWVRDSTYFELATFA
jgi:hypothetical protein